MIARPGCEGSEGGWGGGGGGTRERDRTEEGRRGTLLTHLQDFHIYLHFIYKGFIPGDVHSILPFIFFDVQSSARTFLNNIIAW